MMKFCPWFSRCNQSGGKDDSVECDVVFSHELIKFNVIVWVTPPLLPLVIVVGCNWEVTDWRVKPHVENFVTVCFQWDRSSPFQISGDASADKTLFQKSVCERNTVLGPLAVNLCLWNPLLKFGLNLGQVNKDMFRLAQFWACFTSDASWFNQFWRVH